MNVKPEQSVNDLVMNNRDTPITPNLAGASSILGPAYSPGNSPVPSTITVAT